jgi:YD repeat-containing protein
VGSRDTKNRRTRTEYAGGSVATFTFDAENRLTQIDDSGDPHRPITFTYDPLDRLVTETTSLGIVMRDVPSEYSQWCCHA